MPYFFSNRWEVLETRRLDVPQLSFNTHYIMGTQPKLIRMSIRVEVAKKVKVRAYIRIRNGRIQKVRSHYSIPSVFYLRRSSFIFM